MQTLNTSNCILTAVDTVQYFWPLSVYIYIHSVLIYNIYYKDPLEKYSIYNRVLAQCLIHGHLN